METYVVLPAGACVVQSAAHTVQHYQSAYHKLEERAEILPLVPGEGLSEFFDFCSTNDSGTERKPKEFIPESSFLVGLSSIYWRESWKYGERGIRYTLLDMGHVLMNIRLSAASLGWRVYVLREILSDDAETILGIDRKSDFPSHMNEQEFVDFLILVDIPQLHELTIKNVTRFKEGSWHGKASNVSEKHVKWEATESILPLLRKKAVIEETSDDEAIENKHKRPKHKHGSHRAVNVTSTTTTTATTTKAKTTPPATSTTHPHHTKSDSKRNSGHCHENAEKPATTLTTKNSFSHVVRTRRSAGKYTDKTHSIPRNVFMKFMKRLSSDTVPWDMWNINPPRVQVVVLVYRVEGMASGIYFLNRDTKKPIEEFMKVTKSGFSFSRESDWPSDVPLYLLEAIDKKDLSGAGCYLAAGQELAGDGYFCVFMISEFQTYLEAATKKCTRNGEHDFSFYRELHYEAGAIGELLYLEAENHNLRANGMGCFFDDSPIFLLGLPWSNQEYQCYYFTSVGNVAQENVRRIQTLPSYPPPDDFDIWA